MTLWHGSLYNMGSSNPEAGRDVYKNLKNVYDRIFFAKIENDKKPLTVFAKKLHYRSLVTYLA